MKFKNSMAIIRTRKGNTVGCVQISTYNYQRLAPSMVYDGYCCKEFEIYENVGGQVKVKTFDQLENSKASIENVITLSNVTAIEILSEHDV